MLSIFAICFGFSLPSQHIMLKSQNTKGIRMMSDDSFELISQIYNAKPISYSLFLSVFDEIYNVKENATVCVQKQLVQDDNLSKILFFSYTNHFNKPTTIRLLKSYCETIPFTKLNTITQKHIAIFEGYGWNHVSLSHEKPLIFKSNPYYISMI
jgi:hypothetical protein